MGYRIVYGDDQRKRKQTPEFGFRTMVAVCLLLFALSVRLWWPEGRALMERFLLPAGVGDVQTAFSAVVEDLQNGESFSEAVGAFCREIITDARSGQ